MALLQLTAGTTVDSDSLAKVAFRPSPSAAIGQRADLLRSINGQLVPAIADDVDGLSILQQLRALIGDGTGSTSWVRVRQPGSAGDGEDAYANLAQVGQVEFGSAADGEVARLKSGDGADLGEVHLQPALQVVKERLLR